jgi:hypothetical protein
VTEPSASPRDTKAVEPTWHPLKRILFRFAFCYTVLYYLSWPLRAVPGLSIVNGWYSHCWRLLDAAIGISLFDIDIQRAFPQFTGSGDRVLDYTQQGACLLIAILAGALWTLFDRGRPHYLKLQSWLYVFARYALALVLIEYACAKIIPTQFLHLQQRQLSEPYGQSSPMGLLWNFMGYSIPYTIFSGIAELIPAVLLTFRRTALLGSLLAFAVLLNVVMLNFCYDVPVKLFSLNLLLLSVALILPESRRLLHFFLLNQPTPPSQTEPLIKNPQLQHVAPLFKLAILSCPHSGSPRLHGVISKYRLKD